MYVQITEEVVVRKIYRAYYDTREELAEFIEEYEDSSWIADADFYDDEIIDTMDIELTDEQGYILDSDDAREIREELEEEEEEEQDEFINNIYS